MLPYWIFFLVPAGAFLANRRLTEKSRIYSWILVWFLFSLAIGLRYQVGGDWFNYLRLFEHHSNLSFWQVVSGGDPAYYLLNWLVGQAGGSILWVNTICGMIFMAGVVRFVKAQPLPWLALLVAVPYLIIVVGMGYTRQSVALGFLLIALVSLGNGKMRWFVFWVVLGAAFHKTAVLMLPVAALASTTNRGWSLLWIGFVSLVGGYFFVFDSAEMLWASYVEADMQSQGGMIRVFMNAVTAILFFIFRRYLRMTKADEKLWFWMAILSLVCIPLVILSSTATDRVALYLIPIQIYLFARLPLVVNDPHHRALVALGVIGYYGLVQAVWLFFAAHAYAWVPYQNILWL